MGRLLTTLCLCLLVKFSVVPASAAVLLDFGGDYVPSDQVLSSDTEYVFGGVDGTFTVFSVGTLTLRDGSAGVETDDYFTANSPYMVVWKSTDVSGGGAGAVFDFTTLGSSDVMMIQDSTDPDFSVPLTSVVVEVGGNYYASTRQKQNGVNKSYSRGDIESQSPQFGLINTDTLTVDTDASISFSALGEVSAVGFLVTSNWSRAVNEIRFSGDLVMIPEPTAATLVCGLVLGFLALGRRRR